MGKETIFALAVSLLTWLGVWVYLLRLDVLARSLERTARDLSQRDAPGADEALDDEVLRGRAQL